MTAAPRRGRLARGFTMIELLVAMAILAVLLYLAVPGIGSVLLGNQLTAYANAFSASVQLARSEAIKRNAPITLCRSATGTSCATSGSFEQGWIVFRDANANGTLDAATDTLLQRQQALDANYRFTATAYTLAFQPAAVGSTSGTLVLCRATPSAGEQRRDLTLTSTGRLQVSTVRNGTCP